MNIQDCIKNRIYIPTLCGTSAANGRLSIENIPFFDWNRLAHLAATPNNSVSKTLQSLLDTAAMRLSSLIPTLLAESKIIAKIDDTSKPIAQLSGISNTAGMVGTKRGVSVRLNGTHCKRDQYGSIKLEDIKLVLVTPYGIDFDVQIYEVYNNVRTLINTVTVLGATVGQVVLPSITTNADEIQILAPSNLVTNNTMAVCHTCPASRIDCLVWNGINDDGATVTQNQPYAGGAMYGFILKGTKGCDNQAIICDLINNHNGLFDGMIMQLLGDVMLTHLINGQILSAYTELSKEQIMYNIQESNKEKALYHQNIVNYLMQHRNQIRTIDCLNCQPIFSVGGMY